MTRPKFSAPLGITHRKHRLQRHSEALAPFSFPQKVLEVHNSWADL
jgi:hypothetical protein